MLQTLHFCLLCTVPTKHSLSGPRKHQPNQCFAVTAYYSHISVQVKQTNPASEQSHIFRGLLPMQQVLNMLRRAQHMKVMVSLLLSLNNMCPVTVQYTCQVLRTLLEDLESSLFSFLSHHNTQQEASPPWALSWKSVMEEGWATIVFVNSHGLCRSWNTHSRHCSTHSRLN